MSYLNTKQIQYMFDNNKKLDWADEYVREEWRDARPPLTITSLCNIKWNCVVKPTFAEDIQFEERDCIFVAYICSDENCPFCREGAIPRGHHKVINKNGTDTFGNVVYEETRKRTICKVTKAPVFKEYKKE